MRCLRPDEVAAFLAKALPEERHNTLAAHVDQCDICQRQIEVHRQEAALAGDLRDAFDTNTLRESALKGGAGRAQDIPKHIGLYRILETLGEGGMGVVYLAEQSKPVRRRVALKLIKLGMDTRQVVARFESERQALALMSHPNIAAVYDAGVTEEGRPYFVMEYIRGVPVTMFCDKHRLTLRERLDLFMEVCQAIQHAHQKGIIHRDIKPSNVLVMRQDGKPVPKLIDFGVAKATNQRLTEQTLFTEHGVMIGTPDYMSPEQAEMSPLEVDTRTDVYSLGVLLYELLVGTLPFEPTELRKAGYAEIQRMIREVDPPRPSIRISALERPTGQAVSQNRRLDTRSLHRQLSGDLDWITMRALEKDPARRYATAHDLARDLERYLTHESVEARPPSTSYRLAKWLRRNRLAAIFSSIVFLLVLAGTGTAGWLSAVAAEKQKRICSASVGIGELGRLGYT